MKSARFIHLVAHRGDAAGHPENTLPAFQAALDFGVRFIELDAQLSVNGIPVAIRDDRISRGPTLELVGDLSAAELGKVDASEPQRFGEHFKGTAIPRLVDALSLITRRAETTVFVTLGRASIARFGADQVVAQVAETLKPFRSRCIMVSSDLPAVHRARQSAGFQIGWTINTHDSHTRIKYEALQPEYLFCDRAILPAEAPLWRGPWRWVVRDVPTLEVALNLAARGADFVATPNVRTLSEAMRAHAAANAKAVETPIRDDATTIARTTLIPNG